VSGWSGQPLPGFADRLGVTGIGLSALHVRLDVGGRHQPHLMAEHSDLARPEMGAATGLQPNQARLQLLEKGEDSREGACFREAAL
jgi:hypothetical protein